MSALLFVGPTLWGWAGSLPEGVRRAPPAALGDVWRAAQGGARVIGLVDGVFGGEPPVWHKEILFALAAGVRVLGAASIGALRAAELHPFGMEGVGWIFRAYRDGVIEDDDEVALAHGPAPTSFAPLSEPLVNLRRSLERAATAGVLDSEIARRVVEDLRRRFYPERSRQALRAVLATALGAGEAGRVADWLDAHWVDQKRLDALALIERLAAPREGAPPPAFEPSRTIPWVRLCAELDGGGTPDMLSHEEGEIRPMPAMPARHEPAPPPRPEKPWALAAYVAADNNLAPDLRYDIIEMAGVGATRRVHVLCDIDMPRGALAGRMIVQEGAGTRPRPAGGGAHPQGSDPLTNLGLEPIHDRDYGDPVNLVEMLAWSARACPARETMLVIWGHGQGFRVALDDGSRGSLTLPEIGAALLVAGVPDKVRLSLVAFDACLMSTIENLFQLWGLVPIVLASQAVVPATGFPYVQIIRALEAAETGSPELAAGVADAVIADFARNGRPGTTIAALDADRSEAVVRALDRFGHRLALLQAERRPVLATQRMLVRMFQNGDFVDLIDLAARLGRAIPELQAAAEALAAAARKAVIHARAIRRIAPDGSIVEDPTAHGLSVWYPAQPGLYRRHRDEYRRLRCFAGIEHGWIRFLDALHDVPTESPEV